MTPEQAAHCACMTCTCDTGGDIFGLTSNVMAVDASLTPGVTAKLNAQEWLRR